MLENNAHAYESSHGTQSTRVFQKPYGFSIWFFETKNHMVNNMVKLYGFSIWFFIW